MKTMPRLTASAALLLFAATLAFPTVARAVPTDYLFSFGSPGAGDGQFNGPNSIAIGPTGETYVVDDFNDRIQKFDADGNFLAKWTPSLAMTLPLNSITVTPDGGVWVSVGRYLQKFQEDGTHLFNRGPFGTSSSVGFHLTSDATGTIYLTSQTTGTCTSKFDANGTGVGSVLCVGWFYNGMVVDSDGEIFVGGKDPATPNLDDTIFKRSSAGDPLTSWLAEERELGIDAQGNVYGVDPFGHRVRIYDNQGAFLGEFGTPGGGPGQLGAPNDIAVGADGRIYVVERTNHRISVFGDPAVPVQSTSWGRMKAEYR